MTILRVDRNVEDIFNFDSFFWIIYISTLFRQFFGAWVFDKSFLYKLHAVLVDKLFFDVCLIFCILSDDNMRRIYYFIYVKRLKILNKKKSITIDFENLFSTLSYYFIRIFFKFIQSFVVYIFFYNFHFTFLFEIAKILSKCFSELKQLE